MPVTRPHTCLSPRTARARPPISGIQRTPPHGSVRFELNRTHPKNNLPSNHACYVKISNIQCSLRVFLPLFSEHCHSQPYFLIRPLIRTSDTYLTDPQRRPGDRRGQTRHVRGRVWRRHASRHGQVRVWQSGRQGRVLRGQLQGDRYSGVCVSQCQSVMGQRLRHMNSRSKMQLVYHCTVSI